MNCSDTTARVPQDSPVAPVSFAQAFVFWLQLGLISFGGPAGQIAIMHTELVERRRWISEKRFLHALTHESEIKSTITEPNAITYTPSGHEERWADARP